jgi:hypothetical protein
VELSQLTAILWDWHCSQRQQLERQNVKKSFWKSMIQLGRNYVIFISQMYVWFSLHYLPLTAEVLRCVYQLRILSTVFSSCLKHIGILLLDKLALQFQASSRISQKMVEFGEKNKAAKMRMGSGYELTRLFDYNPQFKKSGNKLEALYWRESRVRCERRLTWWLRWKLCIDGATLTWVICSAKENMTTRDMQKLVQALPQYHEELEKLSLHVNVRA